MRVNSVLLPVRAERLNPLTGAKEVYETGAYQEYHNGRPMGQPFTPGAPRLLTEAERATRNNADNMAASQRVVIGGGPAPKGPRFIDATMPGLSVEAHPDFRARMEATANAATVQGNRVSLSGSAPQGRWATPADNGLVSAADPRAYAGTVGQGHGAN